MTPLEDKYTIKYTGSDDLCEFFEFLRINTAMENVGYSEAEIQIIEKALPDGAVLPKQYKIFLQNAGKKCDMWAGDDYLLIDDEGNF
nr:SMI1/KNR4 family protein [Lachnospiraceae bacterium]